MKRGLIVLAIVTGLIAIGAIAAVAVTASGPAPFGLNRMGPMMRGGGYWGACGSGAGATSGPAETLEEAEQAFETYVRDGGNDDLVVTEVMRFERNDYAIVAERSTGIGAFELLLDPATGVVGLEPGPNMMWNTKYGMHGGSAGRRGMGMWRSLANDGLGAIDAEQAVLVAQAWLDENLPGRHAGTADAFYGYYTLHYLRDGQIDGMLSVNASTGQVWQHSWHGAFIEMTEHED
jgi:hypothetical protein